MYLVRPGEAEERRVERLESHRVADDVRPHPRACRYDDRVVHPGLDVAQPVPRGRGRVQLVQGDELVEEAVVEEQPEEPGRRVAEGDEPLRAGIGLLEPDVAPAEDVAEGLARKGRT